VASSGGARIFWSLGKIKQRWVLVTAVIVGRGHNVFKMVSLELPMVISVGKGGKHVVKVIWQWLTDLATEICPIVMDFGRH